MVCWPTYGPARALPLFSCVSLFISSPYSIELVNAYLIVASYPSVRLLPGGTSARVQRILVY